MLLKKKISKSGDSQQKKYLDLYIRPSSEKTRREEMMKECYRNLLKNQIPFLIEKWEQKLNVAIDDWGVRQMQTKWGSCNIEERRIRLNLYWQKNRSSTWIMWFYMK